jgi:UDP-3-O-acyl N-acetylglucosamine deacetylase
VPAPPNTGIVFVRTDLGPKALVPARLELVTGTQRRTTLGSPPSAVGLVEHVLAALAGLHIDNCYVEVNAPEPPGLDGSAWGFAAALRQAGARLQAARRAIWQPAASIIVRQPGATLALHPAPDAGLRISYILNYGEFSPICPQRRTLTVTPGSFANEVASCRTFLLEEEAHYLRKQGLGTRATLSDLVVFGPRGPMQNNLRYADEPVRHKILDIIGDLSLLGHDIHGHIVAYRSGHPLNIELVRAMSQCLSGGRPRQMVA